MRFIYVTCITQAVSDYTVTRKKINIHSLDHTSLSRSHDQKRFWSHKLFQITLPHSQGHTWSISIVWTIQSVLNNMLTREQIDWYSWCVSHTFFQITWPPGIRCISISFITIYITLFITFIAEYWDNMMDPGYSLNTDIKSLKIKKRSILTWEPLIPPKTIIPILSYQIPNATFLISECPDTKHRF